MPWEIAIDGKRCITIVDEQRHRLQVYIKELDYVEPQFNLQTWVEASWRAEEALLPEEEVLPEGD